jgi:caffeoyl-CoA O-methyltransferase
MHPDWLNDAANYCSEHSSTEPNHLKETVRFTWLNTINPRQLSGHLQGRFLAMMADHKARKAA